MMGLMVYALETVDPQLHPADCSSEADPPRNISMGGEVIEFSTLGAAAYLILPWHLFTRQAVSERRCHAPVRLNGAWGCEIFLPRQ